MRGASALLLAALAAVANAQTTCPVACPAVFSPVCGSDGQTYSNECELGVAKCQSGDESLTVVSTGECPSAGASASGSEGSDASSTGGGDAGGPSCAQEFACLEIYDPVCGSDGVTYGNSCELKFAHCTDASVTQVSVGECASSSPGSVGSDADVGDDDASASTSECSTECTEQYAPVCGSNGVTYDNSCLFDNAQCVNATLSVASDGVCQASSSSSTSSSGSSSASTAALSGLLLALSVAATVGLQVTL